MAVRDELDLIWYAGEGDDSAFAALERRYAAKISWHTRRWYAPGLDASDIRQEALLALHAATISFQPGNGAPFGSYLDLVLGRRLATMLRQATRRGHAALNEAVDLAAPAGGQEHSHALQDVLAGPEGDRPDVRVIAGEDLAGVIARMSTLSALERHAIVRLVNGDDYETIAASAGRGTRSVDNALQRARRKLAA